VLRGGELSGRRILREETLDEATSFHFRNHTELDDGWGLGFSVAEFRGRRVADHDGGLAGVATRLAMLPEEGVGVAVMSNGGDALFPRRIADTVFERHLGLEPELIPGSPRGIAAEQAGQWRTFTSRVTGTYQFVDMFPPGPLARLFSSLGKPKLTHVAEGILALEGVPGQVAFLYPDGDVGRYRLAWGMGNGARVIIEEKDDGVHLWVSILHLHKPAR
jgi:Beta-lactamase